MSFFITKGSEMSLDDDVKAVADIGGIFQSTLNNSLRGLISVNNERKLEIESWMGNHETVKEDHDIFQASAEFQTGVKIIVVNCHRSQMSWC